jgi:hypothetical protein
MSAQVCSRARAFLLLSATVAVIAAPSAVYAQGAPSTFKVGSYNIQAGKGEPALPGHVANFSDTPNCTDFAQPINGWGTGFVQTHLVSSIRNDPKIVALGLIESWASVCASPENVRKVLGWKSRTSERNGVAMVAKYGFNGPEEWLQLDTTLNPNPSDTMWVLRIPVCLDAECSQSLNMFAAHWYASGVNKLASYDRQAVATVAFLQRAGGTEPHVLIADLNVWEGSATICRENPTNIGLARLRNAGYVDAWPLIHGSAEGFTGMINRAGCGFLGEGYAWKRPDYTWSLSNFLPTSIERFGVVPAGEDAPSDHYGLITEFPWPGLDPDDDTSDVVSPTVSLLTPSEGLTVTTASPLSISFNAADNVGVTRVEILEDGVLTHTLTGQSGVSCSHLTSITGTHTVAARAFDLVGNMGKSEVRQVRVEDAIALKPGEIVLYAKNATVTGAWRIVADPEAAGGARLWNPNAGVAKLTAALAAPSNYFELTFNAEAGRAYRLWMRGRAENDAWANDSVYVQFSGSVTAAGTPVNRIGTTGATWVGIEDGANSGLSGWGWQDNGYGTGVLGPLVYFAAPGPQTIRIQQREDGISLDQIVLSPALYLTASPGLTKRDTLVLPLTAGAPPPPPVSATEIVINADTATTIAGTWRLIADITAANGTAIGTVDAALAKITTALAGPVNYAEFTFQAEAGRAYRLWVRGRAERDSWANDSAFVQFGGSLDAAGNAVARIGSTSSHFVNLEDGVQAGIAGWGWQDNGYGAGVLGPVVKFETSGLQTLRIQTREDGFRIDQIVLSAETYLTSAPGALKNDTTILR